MEKQDLHITLNHDALTIAGQKQEAQSSERDGYHYSERRFGQFRRILNLPVDADGEAMEAVFHNGVLSLTIPRHEHHGQGSKTIEIH